MGRHTEHRPGGSFVAQAAEGCVYTIHVAEEWVVSENHDGKSERLNIRSFATEFGQTVNWVRQGE